MAKKDRRMIEEKVPSEELISAIEPELVDFEVWYIMRSSMIPSHHMKEIIKADFRGRGLKDKETMDSFDKALRDYGIKL